MTTEASAATPVRPPSAAPPPRRRGVVRMVVGALLAFVGLWALVGGIAGLVISSHRDADGFYMTGERPFRTEGHAITSAEEVGGTGPDVVYGRAMVGPVRIVGQTGNPDQALFVGIGPADEVARYLDGVDHSEMVDLDVWPFVVRYDEHAGGAPATAPTEQDFWVESRIGTGPVLLQTDLPAGDWRAVVMNADGSAGVQADLAVGATLPVLHLLALAGLVVGVLLVAGGLVLFVFGLRAFRLRRPPA